MLRPIAVLAILSIVAPIRPSPAQTGMWSRVRDDGGRLFDDMLMVWSAPFRASPTDALPALAAVTGAIALVAAFDGEVQDWIRDNGSARPVTLVGPMRHPRALSQIGFTRTLLAVSGALYIAGLAFDHAGLREAGMGCITADLANTLARHTLARLVGRMRPEFTRDPYVIEPFAFGDWPMRSFPGGHVANVMACTAFWDRHFGLGFLGAGLYLYGVAIGFARTIDGAHWLSDTVFGLVFGLAVGNAVADRFALRGRTERATDPAGPAGALGPRPTIRLEWRIPI